MRRKRYLLKIICIILTLVVTPSGIESIAAAEGNDGLKNLALGLSYQVSTKPRDAWEDTGNKELTDGKYGNKAYTDPAWQGHHKNDEPGQIRTILFDLGQSKSIKNISAGFLHAPETGIRFPRKVAIEVSNDGQNWSDLAEILSKKSLDYEYTAKQRFSWDGGEDGVPGQDPEINSIEAQYVRLQFFIDAPWVFIDEVEIWGTDGKIDGEADIASSPLSIDDMNNLSMGMDYILSVPARDSYPDTDDELTDGIYGTKTYPDNAWQGHHKDDGAEQAVLFDLESPKSIKRISVNFLHYPSAGIGFPSKVSVDVSMDGESWCGLSEILSKKASGYEYIATQRFFWDGDEDGIPTLPIDINMIYAQYIRIKFTIQEKNWAFLDQVDIWGKDGKEDGAGVLIPEDDPEEELPEGADYMRCGEETGGTNNLVLLYNHVDRVWKKKDIIPYLSYVDEQGKIKDWFFDGVLYLGLRTPEGNTFDTSTQNPSNKEDWEWYLHRTFKPGGDMWELNSAAQKVTKKLGDWDRKIKVFLMIPYPSPQQSNFGDIDGSGNLNFNHEQINADTAFANRKKAIDWYIDTALENWNQNCYSNLELVGFDWLGEEVNTGVPHEEDLVKYTSNVVQEQGYKHLWIAYYNAAGRDKWKEYGFDMAIIQPNYYFDNYAKPDRLKEASFFARKYGTGMEMELDEAVTKSDPTGKEKRAKYKKYLDDGTEYGYTGDVLKAYYQGGTALLTSSESETEEIRAVYDDTYHFVTGN